MNESISPDSGLIVTLLEFVSRSVTDREHRPRSARLARSHAATGSTALTLCGVFTSQWLSGGRPGGAAEGLGQQPADSQDLPLPEPADRPLPLVGQLLLPSSAGCNLQVGQRGRADVTLRSRSSHSFVMVQYRMGVVSFSPQECH